MFWGVELIVIFRIVERIIYVNKFYFGRKNLKEIEF